jgi:hypothetical protein
MTRPIRHRGRDPEIRATQTSEQWTDKQSGGPDLDDDIPF